MKIATLPPNDEDRLTKLETEFHYADGTITPQRLYIRELFKTGQLIVGGNFVPASKADVEAFVDTLRNLWANLEQARLDAERARLNALPKFVVDNDGDGTYVCLSLPGKGDWTSATLAHIESTYGYTALIEKGDI